MTEFWEACISWPTWPATLLLLAVCGYWLLVIVGAVSLDFLDFDFDLDVDADVHGSLLDLGFVPLRFLNLGSVPVMLWVSVYAFATWVLSKWINSEALHQSFELAVDGPALLRDFGLGAIITKCITQPMRGKFDPVEPHSAKDLIGNTCTITTSEVTETFGEAEYITDGSPLKLKVRAVEGTLAKGDLATIVDFTPEKNIYFVKRIPEEA